MESKITSFVGDDKLQKVNIEHVSTGKISEIDIDGVFVFIGYTPNTSFLESKIALNQWGEILTNDSLQTHIEGVYAAGDCIQKKVRQVTTAVADGTIAALSAADFIHKKNVVMVDV